MLSDILQFLLTIAATLMGIALILRAWTHAVRLHPFNPYSQAIIRVTNWLVQPVRKILSPGSLIDWPSLSAAWLVALAYLLLGWIIGTGSLPSVGSLGPALIAAMLTVARWLFNIILWMTLLQAILSWVNPMAPVMPLLQTLTAPLLDPIRRILPNLGGIDFSPLVLLVLAQIALMVLQRVAFALFAV
ncbi:YggT family protein [Paracandidimonas soli]|uniref:YggT family protein n=2 Tax=Paracandidimonas soli TaxID=1917182 RepID=A0A4R3V195_9BURK|nr:YggT family protein [Paracandidimonas soli]TCU98515.1 YggT family protein [Paracandidimonas soli]